MFKQFKIRSFISISAFLFFIMLLLSGAAAYIKPEGSVASWQSWSFLGLDKGEWEGLHTLIGIFFLTLAFIHIVLNWRMLYLYFRQKSFFSFEMILGVLFLLLVIGSSVFRLPPFFLLMDAGEYISDSWAQKGVAPFNRAERTTLLELCEHAGINLPLSLAMKRLKDSGIRSVDPSITLEELADKNSSSPAELWKIISNGITVVP